MPARPIDKAASLQHAQQRHGLIGGAFGIDIVIAAHFQGRCEAGGRNGQTRVVRGQSPPWTGAGLVEGVPPDTSDRSTARASIAAAMSSAAASHSAGPTYICGSASLSA